MYFLHSSSVCPLPRYLYFSDALVSNYYIDINGIASYHIANKEYINILYKIDIPPRFTKWELSFTKYNDKNNKH